MKNYKKASRDWCRKFRIAQRDILDPDGWDRRNFEYSFKVERVSIVEFESRLGCSTVRFSPAIRRFFKVRDKKLLKRKAG